MPIRAQVWTWIAGFGLVVPSLVIAQDRTEREVVELIVRDGPQARAIRAETEVTRREQLARLAYPNPAVTYSREGAGFTEFLQAEQSLPLFGARAALSRAGVAATAAAEAERDVRLWAAAVGRGHSRGATCRGAGTTRGGRGTRTRSGTADRDPPHAGARGRRFTIRPTSGRTGAA